LNDFEALIVSSVPTDNRTPEPLHIRVPLKNVPVDLAVYSVLAWTLLHYGIPGLPKLPVTIQHADDLAQWLARGMLPDKTEGDVPFWL
jgi:argonaute-like protein implicated in RNA metabolism and viral defense